MKKLLVIAIALLSISTVFAGPFNPTVTNAPQTVGTTIITPLTIDVITTGARDIGNIPQGQERTFTTPTPIALFTINREENQPVLFTVYEPTAATGQTGVTLNTKVYRYTGNWPTSDVFEFAPNTPLSWGSGGAEGGTQCNAAIVVTKATATGDALPGQHTFNVHIVAQYAF